MVGDVRPIKVVQQVCRAWQALARVVHRQDQTVYLIATTTQPNHQRLAAEGLTFFAHCPPNTPVVRLWTRCKDTVTR